ncbi:MAG: hypothetical protein ACJA2N_000929 [Salibacteraceae bacterium]|jgi:hypothetical protein
MTHTKSLLAIICIFIGLQTNAANRYWVSDTTGNWNNNLNWATSNNGTPGASIPSSGDRVYFNSNGTGNCDVDINVSIDGFISTGYAGAIDLKGFSFNPATSGSADATFNGGEFKNTGAPSIINSNTTGQIIFSGTTFNVPINITAGRIRFSGGTFNQAVIVEDNGGGSTNGAGGCIFNATLKVTNSGTSYFLMGHVFADVFNDDLTLINTSTSRIRIAYNAANNQFNGNIYISSSAGSGVFIGESNGSSSLANSKTISVTGSGFSAGELRLKNFTQVGTTPQNITLTGTASFNIESGCAFNAALSASAPKVLTKSSTFHQDVNLTKTGSGDNNSTGGNTFNGNTILNNSGSGNLLMGNGSGDIFNGNVTLNNTGSKNIYLAHRSPGNTIAGTLTVNNNSSASATTDVYIASDSAGSITIGGVATLNNIGSGSNGNIIFGRVGDVILNNNLTINNNTTGASGQVYVANNSQSAVSITGTTTVTNNGSGNSKRVYLGNYGDISFGDDLTINNTSNATNSEILLNHETTSHNVYNGDITISSTVTGCDGIKFGDRNGTGILATTKSLSIGSSFVSGYLIFTNFTYQGTSPISLTTTGTTYSLIKESQFGGNFTIQAPRLYLKNNTFSGNASFEKTGGLGDDYSFGGNTVNGTTTIINSGSRTFSFGSNLGDTLNGDVTFSNTGSSRAYLAQSSAGNVINGNLTINHSPTGTASNYLYVAGNNVSSLSITGNAIINNNGTSTQSHVQFGVSGDVTLGGNLNIINAGSGTHSSVQVATNANSKVIINGNTSATNGNTASRQNRLFFAYNGDIEFNGTVETTNNAGSIESEVFFHHGSTSSIIFNKDITISSNHISCDGYYFGQSGGTGTLASTKTITILGNNPANFIGGDLRLYNFTYLGTTPHNFELSSSAKYAYNSNNTWGCNTSFIAPRIYNKNTTFSGTASFEKTGKDHDDSYGGNTFAGNVEYIHNNNVSAGRTYIASSAANTYNGDLTVKNTAAFSEILLGNAAGTYPIAGDLNLYNSSTGTGSQHLYVGNNNAAIFNIQGNLNMYNNSPSATNHHNMYVSNRGTVNVTGNTTIENTGNSGTDKHVYLGLSGDVNLAGNLSITNSSTANNALVSLANGSSSQVTINGNTTVSNAGAGNQKRVYFGDYGDVTFNGDVTATNNSSAVYSEIFFNYRTGSVSQFNGDISMSSNHASCDGFLFGSAGGAATLASTKTITILGNNPANFIGGDLRFYNFTYLGTTPHNFELSSSAKYAYNSNTTWGCNTSFIAPRIYNKNTTFSGTASFEKTGKDHDYSYGGNTFMQNTIFSNSGSSYLLTGNNAPDDFRADLTLNNTGSNHIYIAHNTTGNQVAGNVIMNQSTSGSSSSIHLASRNTSNITIGGNISANNTSSANNSFIYIGESGDVTCNGDLNITNNPTGTQAYLYVAYNSTSEVTIGGATNVINSGGSTTKRVYLGSSGDITFNGPLSITNNATATNSEIYLNNSSSSANVYNQNITLSSSGLNCDGIRFGQSQGTGTLASGKTISIGGVYSAGELYLRNFNQLGATDQNLTLTGSGLLNVLYSQWNGNVTFQSPRVLLAHTTFNGSSVIEKTGGTNDACTGGNTFNGETTLTNSGTAYFMTANGSPNDFNGNVTYVKSSTGLLYPSYNAKSTYAGNLTIHSNSTVRFAAAGGGKITMDGTGAQSINKIGATPNPEFRTLSTNKGSGNTTLNTPIIITYRLHLTEGNFNTTSTNTIYMNDNTSALTPSNASYVDGPLVKIGNDNFIFPIGGGGFYAPIEMTGPSSSSSRFEASYTYGSAHSAGFDTTLMSSGLDHISSSEYWNLDHLAGSNNVKVKLHWNSSRSGNIASGSLCDLRAAHWTGARWINEGNGGPTGNAVNGSFYTGISENCTNSTQVNSWARNQPFAIAIDSNYITWDGTTYDGGSGSGSAPNTSDAGKTLKIYAPNAILPMDAKVAHVIITSTGKLNIPSGTILEVSGTITNNGEITLENNSSLLQTIAGSDQNTGPGSYLINRTGNNSAYSYNIWSAPIKAAALNTVFSSSNACDIWTFNENNQSWSHDYAVGYATSCYGNAVTFTASDVITGGDGIMDIGRGYFVPGAVATGRTFSGKVNNGDITIPITTTSIGHQTLWDNDDWNLVGNPYPSGLDASRFLLENATDNNRINGAIYFWDAGDTAGGYNQHSDYATFNGLGGVNSGNTTKIPTGQIGSGQGFWVYAAANTNLEFNNSMRTGTNSQFFKQTPIENHTVWVSFTTPNNYSNNILLGYNNLSTDLEDEGLDAHKLEGSANVRFSSLINADEYAIQAFEALKIGASKSIPLLVFSADSGIHTFAKYHAENMPNNITVYIKDNLLGSIHNFENGDYQVCLNAQINYDSRFEIVFEKTIEIAGGGNGSKGSGNPNTDSSDVVTNVMNSSTQNQFVLATTTNGYILNNEDGFSGIIVLMDVTGKVVWTTNQIEETNSITILTNEFSQGIYFIEILTDNQRTYSKKILKQ